MVPALSTSKMQLTAPLRLLPPHRCCHLHVHATAYQSAVCEMPSLKFCILVGSSRGVRLTDAIIFKDGRWKVLDVDRLKADINLMCAKQEEYDKYWEEARDPEQRSAIFPHLFAASRWLLAKETLFYAYQRGEIREIWYPVAVSSYTWGKKVD